MTVEERIAELSAEIAGLEQRGDDDKCLAEKLIERGKLQFKLGAHSAALTDYNRAASLDPDSAAQTLAAQTLDILNFFNPDIYNP